MTEKKLNVLIVDDEQVICNLLYQELSEQGYLCTTVLDGDSALARIRKERFDIVLLDIRLPGISGMEVLREILLNHTNTATIMITAVNDVDTAVEAMKLGASDYIVKPFDLNKVRDSVLTALEKQQVNEASTQLDAIAAGVEVKLDPFSAYSKVVTQNTMDIARQLDIDEGEIQRWATAKSKLSDDKEKVINPK